MISISRAVQRADDLDVERGRCLEDLGGLQAVFAHDAKIVSARFASPSLRIFHVVGAKLTKAVCCEHDLVLAVIGHHDFRPVHHGCEHECEDMAAQNELFAVLDDLLLHSRVLSIELLHEGECFGVSDNNCIGIHFEEAGDIGGMIGLHVLHDQIIGLSAVKNCRQVVKPFLAKALVNSIHDRDLLIHDDIGIVCHSKRHNILSLKQINFMIIYTNILDIICNSHFTLLYIDVLDLHYPLMLMSPLPTWIVRNLFPLPGCRNWDPCDAPL